MKFPEIGEGKSLNVISKNGREKFIIDINRKSTIKVKKCTYQKRYRSFITLLRLDIEGSPHTNPDGEVILGSHFHIYKEGFGDAWAYPIPKDITDPPNLIQTLIDFLKYCKVINIDELKIQGGITPMTIPAKPFNEVPNSKPTLSVTIYRLCIGVRLEGDINIKK